MHESEEHIVEFEQEVQRRGSTSLSITVPSEIRRKLGLKPGDIVKVKIVEIRKSKILLPPDGAEFETVYGKVVFKDGKFVVYDYLTGQKIEEIPVEDVERRYAELSITDKEHADDPVCEEKYLRDCVTAYIVVMIRIAEIIRESLKQQPTPVEHSGATFTIVATVKTDDLATIFKIAERLTYLLFTYRSSTPKKKEVEPLFTTTGEVRVDKEGEDEPLHIIIRSGGRLVVVGDRSDLYDIDTETIFNALRDQKNVVMVKETGNEIVEEISVYDEGKEMFSYNFEE